MQSLCMTTMYAQAQVNRCTDTDTGTDVQTQAHVAMPQSDTTYVIQPHDATMFKCSVTSQRIGRQIDI